MSLFQLKQFPEQPLEGLKRNKFCLHEFGCGSGSTFSAVRSSKRTTVGESPSEDWFRDSLTELGGPLFLNKRIRPVTISGARHDGKNDDKAIPIMGPRFEDSCSEKHNVNYLIWYCLHYLIVKGDYDVTVCFRILKEQTLGAW